MKEKVNEIKEKLDNTDEIKQLKQLNEKLNSNEEYLNLMGQFLKNKDLFIQNNTYEKELINLRKKLFSIPELMQYLKLQSDLRLEFTKINNIILSIID